MATQLDHYRLLGRSGLRVSPLSLGTMTFGIAGGWGSEDAEAERMFNHYVERGGNFIDTANFYGESEVLLGQFMQGRRDQLVLATKYSLSMRPGDPNASGNHRKNMMQSVENSLRRLQTDYIDLLYLHVWDDRTPVDEILRAFDDLVRAGKVNYIGISDTPAWQVSRMQTMAELRGWAPLVALQILYNLTERTVERELIPMARELGLGVLPWSPLAGGILSGKYDQNDLAPRSQTEAPTIRSRKDMNLARGSLTEGALAIAGEVGTVAGEIGCTTAQAALAWTLLNPAVTSSIIGARTYEQFEDNLGALEVTFSDEQIAHLDAISRVGMGFPHNMIAYDVNMGMMFGEVNVERRRDR